MRRVLVAVCLLPLFAVGCGPTDKPATVAGTVLMDGQPLQEGEIVFEAADQKTAPASGPILNGQYRLEVMPGLKRVKVSSSRTPSKPDPVMGMAPVEARLGPEYNEKTTLSADIKVGVNESVDFQVKELKRK